MAATGDAVALFQTLMSATWYGVVGDSDTPGGMAATLEMVDNEAVITTDVLIGPKGDPGEPSPIVKLQWPALESATELQPFRTQLGNNATDIGKAWWVGSVVYVWDGSDFRMVRPGPAGPAGATPQITVSAETIPLDERGPGVTDEVEQSGTSLNPHLHFKLLSPQGPEGPSTNITGAPDYDNTNPPEDGQTLVWSADLDKWTPSDYAARQPKHYSVPEQAFSNFSGLAQTHTILSYVIEAQDFDWTPYVTGHIKARGIELDSDPLTIGCEVRLGDAETGQLIARGFGDRSDWTHLKPHFSTPGEPTRAVSPDNQIATVQAGQTATINVRLYNDGLIGSYVFNRTGAQLSILCIPKGL